VYDLCAGIDLAGPSVQLPFDNGSESFSGAGLAERSSR
jgi:hypothetical protein